MRTPSAVGKKFYNTDVREYGSGNTGATMLFESWNSNGIPALIGYFKILSCFIYLFNSVCHLLLGVVFEHKLAFGISAVVGHLFVYTGLGEGVMLGVLIALHSFSAFFLFVFFFLFSLFQDMFSCFNCSIYRFSIFYNVFSVKLLIRSIYLQFSFQFYR